MVQQFDSVGDDVRTSSKRGESTHCVVATSAMTQPARRSPESDYRGFLTQYAYDENGNQVEKGCPLATSTWILSTTTEYYDHGVLRLADFLHGLGAPSIHRFSGTPLDSMLTVYQDDQAGSPRRK